MSQILKVEEQITRPGRKRICVDCDREIIRNLAITSDGAPHHFGCLKKDHARPVWHCMDCDSELTRSQVVEVYSQGRKSRTCGICGSYSLQLFRDYIRTVGVVHG